VNPRRADAGVSPAERDAIEKANALDRQLYEYACELLDSKVEEAGARFRRELTAFRHENANFIEANARRRVDLNHAPMKELCTLPGVGPTIAQRIVEYRELRGGFRTVKELARIRGIGPSRRWRLLDRVIP
jgi:competence ComEA-like helix-hairpin-helix protein